MGLNIFLYKKKEDIYLLTIKRKYIYQLPLFKMMISLLSLIINLKLFFVLILFLLF